MRLTGPETCPLPADPLLAQVAATLNAAGTWAFLVDPAWRLVYMTDEIRLSNGGLRERVPVPLDTLIFGPDAVATFLGWSGGQWSVESWRRSLRALRPWLEEDAPGAAGAVDPRLADVLAEDAGPALGEAASYVIPATYSVGGIPTDVVIAALRLRHADGARAGTAFFAKPAAGMSVFGMLAAAGDLQHLDRVQRLVSARRRPMAILFADLERSTPLARRLSTSAYFTLGRRLVRAADQRVVDAGGIVGRHAGDGVVAFFLAEHAGSEAAAARACVEAARGLRADVAGVAERSGLDAEDVVMRFGLHWGGRVHIGQVATAGRLEVDALGDEVNEAARIEACATGGRVLASKELLERLDDEDLEALGLGVLSYTALGELPGAPEKARRDAPALAVCAL